MFYLKFYIVKRAEREACNFEGIVEFESHHELLDYLNYHRAYITEMRSLAGMDND